MSSPDLMLVCCGGLGLRLVASGREVVLRLPMSAREVDWRVPTCGNYLPPPPPFVQSETNRHCGRVVGAI